MFESKKKEEFLSVRDYINGGEYWLYQVDVCCGKALLIGKSDNRFYVRSLLELAVEE